MIPKTVHFVFGLRPQDEPMHFLQYVAIESCRRVLEPDIIYLHYHYLPWGPWWDRIAPFVTPLYVELVPEVENVPYSDGLVPLQYRYAHHADFVRLDALIEHGGIYADIDTIFLRAPRTDLFTKPFVIGEEGPLLHPRNGTFSPSLCNAYLMAEPSSLFAKAWRERMASALDGTWSNHSGTLAQQLRLEMPNEVQVEPQATFYPFGSDPISLYGLLLSQRAIPQESVSVHLWSHLWWERQRLDVSVVHADWCTPSALRRASTTLSRLVEEYLPTLRRRLTTELPPAHDAAAPQLPRQQMVEVTPEPWLYLSYDDDGGYGTAARRTMDALNANGVSFDWAPLVRSQIWARGYATLTGYDPFRSRSKPGDVVIAHTTPEYFADLRSASPEAFLVAHTIWETDRLPRSWPAQFEVVDLIVVASTWEAEVIRASGVGTPVEVIPHPLASVRTAATNDLWEFGEDRYVFYTIAEWTSRQGVEATVEAYLRAFRRDDPVLLVVKTSTLDRTSFGRAGGRKVEPGTSAWSLSQILARHPSPAAIRLVTTPLTDPQVEGLHRRGNSYVSLTRAEGWGIGAFDAAASGNSVIATGWGGHLDYLGESPYLVNYTLVPVDETLSQESYSSEQRWAEPDIDHAAHLLRSVYENSDEANSYAKAKKAAINSSFRPSAVGAKWKAVIERRTPRPSSSA